MQNYENKNSILIILLYRSVIMILDYYYYYYYLFVACVTTYRFIHHHHISQLLHVFLNKHDDSDEDLDFKQNSDDSGEAFPIVNVNRRILDFLVKYSEFELDRLSILVELRYHSYNIAMILLVMSSCSMKY